MITILAIQSKKAACGRFLKQLLDIGDGKVTTTDESHTNLLIQFAMLLKL
jgi:hypothetical protein